MNKGRSEQVMMVITVDDSPIMYKIFSGLMSGLDFIEWGGHAYNLTEAREMITQKKPKVVLLDIQLQDESGFDLLAEIKQRHPSMHFIVVTNMVSIPYREKSKSLGSNHFLDKSNDLDSLPAILKSLNTVSGC